MLRDFHFEARGRTKVWLHREVADGELIDRIADCDRLLAQPGCRIIKDEKKIKVGHLRLSIAGRTYQLYIKRYNAFSLRYCIGSLLRPSAAVSSLRGAALLKSAGIRTARPLAAAETRLLGMVTRSFLITEAIAGGKTADAYWLEDLGRTPLGRQRLARRDFLAGLASLFRTLHEAGIYHNDLKDANIMAAADPQGGGSLFFLLDLEGVRRFGRLGERRRIKNLVQINRTLGRYVPGSGKLYFLMHYLGAVPIDRRRTKRLIRAIQAESDRLDAAKGIEPARGVALGGWAS